MSYNGHTVIDMDCHVREYADLDRTYKETIDPKYRDAYEQLSLAVRNQQRSPGEQVLFMTSRSVVGPTPARRPLGVYDTFGVEPAPGSGAGRSRANAIDPACNWDPAVRLRDMDTAGVDISVMFASQADGFCVLRDVGFEQALHHAYHRYMSSYCAGAKGRLRWVANCTVRDPQSSAAELTAWAEKDENLAGLFMPRACPDGRLLDNPDLHPLFQRAQDLDLPIMIHGGTLRPPLTPGALALDNSGFLINALYHAWGGMTAVGALIGGGVFDLFPRLRIGVFESGAGWMPWLIERLDDSYRPGSAMTPHLKRRPSEVVEEGRLFCALDSGEEYIEFCVEELGEQIWLFSTDYPHPGTSWPDGLPQVVERPGLAESAKLKLLGENAKRFCPRLSG